MNTLRLTPTAGGKLELTGTKDFGTSDAYADNVGWTTLLGGPYGISHTGVAVNPVNSMQVAAIYACIRILTGDVAKLPLRLLQQRDDGIWLPAKKHPLARLMRRPNRRMTQHDFTQHIVMSLLLVGNAYVAVIRDERGVPVELVPLIPSTVSIREDGDGRLFYMVTNRLFPGRKIQTFTEEDIVHVRSISLDGGIRGASPTQLASEVFGLALATQEFAASMFRNGANFQGMLTTDQSLNKETVEQISAQWNRRDTGGFSGSNNAYKTPLLQGGLKFQPISQDAQQSQLLDTRRQLVEECARIFGVPLYKLSSVDKLGYNSIDAQSQDYIDSTLIPLTNPIEQALEQKLLFDREFDDFRFAFDFADLERGDIKTRTEHHHMLLADGVLNVNEIRNRMNLPGIGPEGDIYTKPMNTGVLGQAPALPNYQINAPAQETAEPTAENTDVH